MGRRADSTMVRRRDATKSGDQVVLALALVVLVARALVVRADRVSVLVLVRDEIRRRVAKVSVVRAQVLVLVDPVDLAVLASAHFPVVPCVGRVVLVVRA